jgi:hypothetical protein
MGTLCKCYCLAEQIPIQVLGFFWGKERKVFFHA